MLIFDQLFKTLGINSGLDEKQWDVDPREIKPQAEIKPTEPQGLLGPLQSRVGRFLQGDTGFPNPFEGLPKPQLPEPGITSEGTITKNYTPGVSEAGYLATNLVDLIGGGVQDFLTTAGEGLQEWGEGYPLFRQTEMGGYIPWATETGKKNIETAIGASPIGGAARRTLGEGVDAIGGLFKQLEPPSPGTTGAFFPATTKEVDRAAEILQQPGKTEADVWNELRLTKTPNDPRWYKEIPTTLERIPSQEWSVINPMIAKEGAEKGLTGQALQDYIQSHPMYDPRTRDYMTGQETADYEFGRMWNWPEGYERDPSLRGVLQQTVPETTDLSRIGRGDASGLAFKNQNRIATISREGPIARDQFGEIIKEKRGPDLPITAHEIEHIIDPMSGFNMEQAWDMWFNYSKPRLEKIRREGFEAQDYPGQFQQLEAQERLVNANEGDPSILYWADPGEGRARLSQERSIASSKDLEQEPFGWLDQRANFERAWDEPLYGDELKSFVATPDVLPSQYWTSAELKQRYLEDYARRGFPDIPTPTSIQKTQSGLPRIQPEPVRQTGLFSKMEEEILNMPQEKMTTLQFRNYLENKGVKRAEITESGILGQIADENNRVTKSRALNFLRDRDMPTIDDVYMGETPEDLFDPADWRIDPDNAEIVPMAEGQLDDMIETALDDELGGGQWNGTRENARDYVRLLNEYDPDTYPLDDPNDNWADAFVNTVVFEGIRSNDIPPSIYDDIKTIIGEREAAVYDDMAEYTWTVGDDAGHREFTVTGNMDQGFTITDAHTGDWVSDAPTIEEANIQLRVIGRQVSEDLSERAASATTMFSEWTPDNMNMGTYEEETIYLPRLSKEAREYIGPHWDNPDVGLHLRTSQEELVNGADSLFVLENQSDLHQRGRKYGYDDSTPEQRKAKVAKADQNLKDAERKAAPLGIEFANKAEAGDFPPETLKNLDDLLDQYYRLGAGISPNDFSQSVRRRKIANVITETYTRNQNFMPTRKEILDAVINTVDKDPNLQKYLSAFKAEKEAAELSDIVRKRPPRAMLEGDQAIETGFNRAVMKAIDEGRDGISWATSEIQKDLYPNAKSDTLYENQYDKKMVSYAKKLATKYNTKVEMVGSKMAKPPVKGKEPEYYQVHYLPFTKEMKAELKKKGMPLYSGAPAAGLLAGEEDAGENQQKGLLGM